MGNGYIETSADFAMTVFLATHLPSDFSKTEFRAFQYYTRLNGALNQAESSSK